MIDINRNVIKLLKPLPPSEKQKIIDYLFEALDESDERIDEIWKKEAGRRLRAIKSGKTKLVSYELASGVTK